MSLRPSDSGKKTFSPRPLPPLATGVYSKNFTSFFNHGKYKFNNFSRLHLLKISCENKHSIQLNFQETSHFCPKHILKLKLLISQKNFAGIIQTCNSILGFSISVMMTLDMNRVKDLVFQ